MRRLLQKEIVNKIRSKTVWTITGIAAVTVAALAISCATVKRVVAPPPIIPGAKYVGLEQCAACHESIAQNFKLTQHSRLEIPGEGDRVGSAGGCESCHGPGSLHVDAGGGRGKFIVNPKKEPEACFQCHLEKKAEFSLQYHHPVLEGRMSCTSCHDPHGAEINTPKGTFVGRVNAQCAQCHRQQTKLHVFEHEALREGCITCHNVHGSINPKMLTERDNNLCLKCHAQVQSTSGMISIGNMPHAGFPPTEFLKRGSCYSAGCHSAVHGSDVNAHLRY